MSKYDHVLRPFVAMMEKELHANAGKGDRPGWLAMSADTCLLEIFYHLGKLQKAVKKSEGDGIGEYAADAANMCMMLADICGVLAIANPVPPVGGDVEVPAMPDTVDRRPYDDEDPEGYLEGDDDWSSNNPGAVSWLADNHAEIRQALVDRAQVTRLQTEVERLKQDSGDRYENMLKLANGVAELKSELTKALEDASKWKLAHRLAMEENFKLTKARELLDSVLDNPRLVVAMPSDLLVQIKRTRSSQPAPANKGHGEPVAEIVSKLGDPEAFGERELIALKDISKFPYGTKLYAAQPAPVAVVMPDRKPEDAIWWHGGCQVHDYDEERGFADGWNDCLDEVARLNSEPKP